MPLDRRACSRGTVRSAKSATLGGCRKFVLALIAVAGLPSISAQQSFTHQELCPDYQEVDPLQDCQIVSSYAELKQLIEQTPSGGKLDLCPFFVQKVSSADPITIRKGIHVTCVRHTPESICVINGMGHHVWIDTSENTRWQGFSFRGSSDHAVYIVGEVEKAENASHSFCQSSFIQNIRTRDTRGGAFMAESSAGTVNIVECLFSENFSTTFGAGIYSRTDQLNVINSLFVKNRSNGYGGAIFIASGASLMIRDTAFISNTGRETHDIVYNPKSGTETYQDGFGNSMKDGPCRGVFDLSEGSCFFFQAFTPQLTSPPTDTPPKSPTTPTNIPTIEPTSKLTRVPTKVATSFPTGAPILPPTKMTDAVPILPSSYHPTKMAVLPPSTQASTKQPIMQPSREPTEQPQKSPVATSIQSPMVPHTTFNLNKPSPAPTKLVEIRPSNHEISVVPTTKPQTSRWVATPYEAPSSKMNLAPSRPPSPNVYIQQPEGEEGFRSSMCMFEPFDGECIRIQTYTEFEAAISQGDRELVFCGGFRIFKSETAPTYVNADTTIRCLDTCTIFGTGPFIQVGGAMSRITFSNMKFMMAETDPAVLVMTMTSLSVTSFCDTEFESNNIGRGRYGGAIYIDERSGVVNVIRATFTDNSASKGGAIYNDGFTLNIIDSRFVANKALDWGSAIYIGGDSQVTIKSSTFLLNTIDSSSGNNYAIVVAPMKTSRTNVYRGSFIDAGKNRVIMSGDCSGFYDAQEEACADFVPMISG